eukprot:590650-Pyramimonas_sp.AAC.1
MKPNVHIMNFARGEIVDGAALKVCNIPTPSTHCLWIFTLRYQPSTSTPYTLLFGSSQFNIWSSSPPNSQPLTLHVHGVALDREGGVGLGRQDGQ